MHVSGGGDFISNRLCMCLGVGTFRLCMCLGVGTFISNRLCMCLGVGTL